MPWDNYGMGKRGGENKQIILETLVSKGFIGGGENFSLTLPRMKLMGFMRSHGKINNRFFFERFFHVILKKEYI
jgi:hypothetical protein